tara:strand:+ start:2097 stop:2321 length:225 start_codon:yes stop_codon:yes gene_type:complete
MTFSPEEYKQKRKEWNKTYYQKQQEVLRGKNAIFYRENKNKVQDRQRYYYYKKTHNLEKLKKKYPDVYNMFVIV